MRVRTERLLCALACCAAVAAGCAGGTGSSPPGPSPAPTTPPPRPMTGPAPAPTPMPPPPTTQPPGPGPAPTPDAGVTTFPDGGPLAPAPDAAGPDAAADTADAYVPGAGPDTAPPLPGAPPPLGARFSLEENVAARWTGTYRSIAMEEGRRLFTGRFQAGKFGGGDAGHIIRFPLHPGREYVFEYRFRFDSGFDFSRGGKIPGLGGGNAPSGCDASTGVGFTARQMWRENGRLIGYIYDMHQAGECGNAIETGFNFTVGRWYQVRQRIKLNTGRADNGVLQLWIDDRQVINRSNMGWMIEAPDRRIDRVFLDFFFGGSTADWAPSRACTITFGDVYATRVAD
jgi:hypothetical protein